MPIRVIICDDQAFWSDNAESHFLSELLAPGDDRIDVVAKCATASEAITEIRSRPSLAQVVVVDDKIPWSGAGTQSASDESNALRILQGIQTLPVPVKPACVLWTSGVLDWRKDLSYAWWAFGGTNIADKNPTGEEIYAHLGAAIRQCLHGGAWEPPPLPQVSDKDFRTIRVNLPLLAACDFVTTAEEITDWVVQNLGARDVRGLGDRKVLTTFQNVRNRLTAVRGVLGLIGTHNLGAIPDRARAAGWRWIDPRAVEFDPRIERYLVGPDYLSPARTTPPGPAQGTPPATPPGPAPTPGVPPAAPSPPSSQQANRNPLSRRRRHGP